MNLGISAVVEVPVIGGQIKHLLYYMIIRVLQFIMGAPQISR